MDPSLSPGSDPSSSPGTDPGFILSLSPFCWFPMSLRPFRVRFFPKI